MTTKTPQEQAQEYSDNVLTSYLESAPKQLVEGIVKKDIYDSFLAAHASRDEEVLRLQSAKESLISMLMELTHDIKHYIPSYPEMWNVAASVEKAEQLLSKYSKTGNDEK